MRLLTFATFASLAAVCCLGLEKAPAWTLDLSLPPQQRFVGAVETVVAARGWDNSIGAVLGHYKAILSVADAVLGPIFADVLKSRFPERYAELQGIATGMANVGHPEVNMTTIVLFPFLYEAQHIPLPQGAADPRPWPRACTGILSLPADTTLPMLHGRNMDESPEAGRNVTLNITVVRGNVTAYSIFDWTWITGGTYTASRLGGVTLEENWNNDGTLTIEGILARVMAPDFTPVAFLFRHIQESGMTFDAAAAYLMNATLAAPAYIIMSGPGRVGHVLTLRFNKTDNVKETLSDASPVTYMVQTNYDRWLPDPPSDPRRTVAEQALAMEGRARSGTELGLWMALGTYPVHNPHTMFTVLMSVEQMPEGYVRRAMVPQHGRRYE